MNRHKQELKAALLREAELKRLLGEAIANWERLFTLWKGRERRRIREIVEAEKAKYVGSDNTSNKKRHLLCCRILAAIDLPAEVNDDWAVELLPLYAELVKR